MTQTIAQTRAQSLPDTIDITDLDQFVAIITAWHQNRVAQLEHLLEIPEGTEASLNDDETIKLEGDIRTGFLIGITVGLTQLGKLPFVAEMAPEATDLASTELG